MHFLLVFLFIFSTNLFAQNEELDLYDASKAELNSLKRIELHQECLNNKKLLKKKYNIHCEKNYHHYNSSAYTRKYRKDNILNSDKVRIAEFNALHPGMSKTRYKDYKKIAQMLNRFDVVGVTELIPLMASDLMNNEKVVNFLNQTPREIRKIKKDILELKRKQRYRASAIRARKIKLLELKYHQLTTDAKKAKKLYREPGYLKILTELHKLKNGKDWALILSPRGEGADTSYTHELVGYYYRSSIVKPKDNDYCRQIRKDGRARPLACIVNMDAKDLGEDKEHVFSRRPFLAEFISGRFSFILLTSHVIFDSPEDEQLKEQIITSSLGRDAYNDFGTRSGLTAKNWARFAEVKVTLEFIQRYLDKYKRDDLIFMGDFNLEAKNPYWEKVLTSWPGSKIYIHEKTSTTTARYVKDAGDIIPTFGLTSNYDHFIFDPKRTKECTQEDGSVDAGAFNFLEGRFASYLNRIYKVRIDGDGPRYHTDELKYQKLFDRHVEPYLNGQKQFLTIGKKHVSFVDAKGRKHKMTSRGVINDEKELTFHTDNFVRRVMDSQLDDKTYYSFYEQVISDHLPIYLNCSNR